jgi:hypothetical protein
MARIPTPLPIDPGWYEAYWLIEPPPRRHRVRDALRRLADALTATRTEPHSRIGIPVLACQTQPTALPLPPI